jgi:uncharacterized protein with HEPN domain
MKVRDFSADLYQRFLKTDLTNYFCLMNYLKLFDYPGRSKLKTPEALVICQSIQRAIREGWTSELLNHRDDIQWFWIPPGGSCDNAISLIDVVKHYQIQNSTDSKIQIEEQVDLKSLVISHRPAILKIAAQHGVTNIRLLGLSSNDSEASLQKLIFNIQVSNQLDPWFPIPFIRDLRQLLGVDVQVVLAQSLTASELDYLNQSAKGASDRDRLLRLHAVIEQVTVHTPSEQSAFESNQLLQATVFHYLQCIGVVAQSISEEFRLVHTKIPWQNLMELSHGLWLEYPHAHLSWAWEIAHRALPEVKPAIEHLLSELSTYELHGFQKLD